MPIPHNELMEFCNRAALGNQDAAQTLFQFSTIARLADNIIDGDSDDPQSDMAHILNAAMVELPGNPFWRAHCERLASPWVSAILGWIAGDQWRAAENEKTRMFAFVYREAIEHTAFVVAHIVGGLPHAVAVMNEIQRVSHQASDETFEDWAAE